MKETGSSPVCNAMTRWAVLCLLVGVFGLSQGCGGTEEFTPYLEQTDVGRTLEINGQTITVETAITGAERRDGLSHRPSLPENYGMLFVYPEPDHLHFWMKDTYINLDIAFLTVTFDEEGIGQATVVNIEQMEKLEESPGAIAHQPVTMALEMRKDWFASNQIGPGSKFTMPEWVYDLRVE